MPLDASGITRLFATFERQAFRLETLAVYATESETDVARWAETGENEQSAAQSNYRQMVRAATNDGRSVQRVHLLSTWNLNPYLAYEFTCYAENVDAGEDVRLKVVDKMPEQGDFWLFDDAVVVTMTYDEHGRHTGGGIITDERIVARYRSTKEAALADALPFSEYERLTRGAALRSEREPETLLRPLR